MTSNSVHNCFYVITEVQTEVPKQNPTAPIVKTRQQRRLMTSVKALTSPSEPGRSESNRS